MAVRFRDSEDRRHACLFRDGVVSPQARGIRNALSPKKSLCIAEEETGCQQDF